MSSLNPTYHPRSAEPMTQFDGPAEFLTERVPSYGYLSGPGRYYDGEVSSSSETYCYVSPDSNVNSYGEGMNIGVIASAGPILPGPSDMQVEEGVFLREWRRQNTLEEKEVVEKEMLNQIIMEAHEYKKAYHEKSEANWVLTVE